MSINTIAPASTMQTQMMQDMQQMKAVAQAPVLSPMQINAVGAQSASSPVSFDRVMQGALNHVDQFQQVAEQNKRPSRWGKAMTGGGDDRQSAGIVIVFRAGAGT